MQYPHGNWYCKPNNKNETKEIIARAIASGAVIADNLGWVWDYYPAWGVFSGATNTGSFRSSSCVKYTIDELRQKFPLPGEPAFDEIKQKQWRGPEDGLPPIGTVCMVQHEKINNNKLTRVEILKHHPETNACAFFWIDAPKHQPNLFWSSKFHPINTERQKWIDEAVVVSATPEKELGKVYDAIKSGLLAIPK